MMVGSLASRVERWQNVIEHGASWGEATVASLYRDEPPGESEVKAGETALRAFWVRIEAVADEALAEGQIGVEGKIG